MIHLARPQVGAEEHAALARVLESGVLVQGPETKALEAEWARACDARFAVATSSGTTALMIALLAHGIGPGDEVITTPFTFVATTNAILHTGATPVFVDVEEDTGNIDAKQLAAALSPKTKAVLPVHLFGQPCDLDAVSSFAEAHGLVVIEDAAQAMGASYAGRKIGSEHTTCFSLYATKNVMAGEGGMITTGDEEVARRARMLRSHGREAKEEPQFLGFNARMSELHAALGRASLHRLEASTAARQANASRLSGELASEPEWIRLPVVRDDARTHVWHQYTLGLRTDRIAPKDASGSRAEVARMRNDVVTQLREAGVGVGVFYRTPSHSFPFVRERGARVCGPSKSDPERLPVAEKLASSVFSVPIHAQLSEGDVARVAREVRRAVDLVSRSRA